VDSVLLLSPVSEIRPIAPKEGYTIIIKRFLYLSKIVFTSGFTGVIQLRSATVRIGLPDYPGFF